MHRRLRVGARQGPLRRPPATVAGGAIPFQDGRFRGERPGVAGVTEEHLPGPKTAGLRQGRSPTSLLSQSAASGSGRSGGDLIDMEGFIRYRVCDWKCDSGRMLRPWVCLHLSAAYLVQVRALSGSARATGPITTLTLVPVVAVVPLRDLHSDPAPDLRHASRLLIPLGRRDRHREIRICGMSLATWPPWIRVGRISCPGFGAGVLGGGSGIGHVVEVRSVRGPDARVRP